MAKRPQSLSEKECSERNLEREDSSGGMKLINTSG